MSIDKLYCLIIAKRISQIEDYDDDVIVLPQIYSLIEEERWLHVFDYDIETNTTYILGGGSK